MQTSRTCPPTDRSESARLAAATLAALLLSLAACGGGNGSMVTPPPTATAALVRAQPGELADYLRERVRQRQGLGSPVPATATGSAPADLTAAADAAVANTWLQEPGVDEDDLIKAAGNDVFTLHDGTLRHDRLAAPGVLIREHALALTPEPGDGQTHFHGLYLSDDARQAIVVGQSWNVGNWVGDCGAEVCPALGLIAVVPTVQQVLIQPVATGAALVAGDRIVIDGRWVGSRRIGDRLIVVTTHLPALAVDALPPTASMSEREAAIAALQVSDLLPRVRTGRAPARPLVAETDCLLQSGNASPDVQITTVTAIDLASPTLAQRSLCFVGGSEALYMSPEALILATTRWSYADAGAATIYPSRIQTDVHRFSIDGALPAYRASGTVDGHLGWDTERKPNRFSEWNGHLRVLSFTGEVGWAGTADAHRVVPSPATLTVLREEGSLLREVARLPNAQRPEPLGKPGEQVYAVRFAADRGYLVTFREIDPLYVLDLSIPADPRTTGVLEVPGFSQDLFPTGDGWLLGVGRDADTVGTVNGVKLALFDVRDPTQPRLHDSRVLGGAGSNTALDFSRHGLNLRWQDGVARVALPVVVTTADGWRHGLQRLEVDPTLGTMTVKPLIDRTPGLPWPVLSAERSVQIGNQLLWLSQDQVSVWAW